MGWPPSDAVLAELPDAARVPHLDGLDDLGVIAKGVEGANVDLFCVNGGCQTRDRRLLVIKASHPPHSGPVNKKQTMGMVVQRRAVIGSLDPFYVQFVRGMEDVLLLAGVDLLMQIRRTTDEEMPVTKSGPAQKRCRGCSWLICKQPKNVPGLCVDSVFQQ